MTPKDLLPCPFNCGATIRRILPGLGGGERVMHDMGGDGYCPIQSEAVCTLEVWNRRTRIRNVLTTFDHMEATVVALKEQNAELAKQVVDGLAHEGYLEKQLEVALSDCRTLAMLADDDWRKMPDLHEALDRRDFYQKERPPK